MTLDGLKIGDKGKILKVNGEGRCASGSWIWG